MVCGILLIMTSAASGCVTLSMPLQLLMSRMPTAFGTQPAAHVGGVIANTLIYLFVTAGLIVLGIGCIRARRWVPPILLSTAWVWLIGGLISIPLLIVALPPMLRIFTEQNGAVPPLMVSIIVGATLCFVGVIYIVLPALLIWFIKGESVRKTCEYRNPQPCWTDRCPRRTLGLSIALGMLSPTVLAGLAYQAIPVFGWMMPRVPAAATLIALATAMMALAVQIARQRMSAWWAMLALTIVMLISPLVSLTKFTIMDFYIAMGMGEMEMAFLLEPGVDEQVRYVAIALVAILGVASVWYLMTIRGDFITARVTAATASPAPRADGQ